MSASWGNYFWYPIVTGLTSPGLQYDTSLVQTRAREYANANLSLGQRRIQITSGQMSLSDVDQWEAFQRNIKGRHGRFLFILKTRHFEMTDSLIATGDGAETEFQLKKVSSYNFGPENSVEEIVRFPWHNYPPLTFANGKTYLDTEYITVKVDGVTKTLTSDYTVEREGGIVTFNSAPADGALITVTCRFALLCRQSEDFNPIQATSGAHTTYTIPSGLEIYEPRFDITQSLDGS